MAGELHDPREMRKVMMLAIHRGDRIDGNDFPYKINSASALARNVIYSAESMGYSGEDTMTMLAYHALLALEQSNDRLLEMANLSPTPLMVPTNR
jgi:hypothetical protein